MEGGEGVDLAFLLRLDTGRAALRGTVVHAWCEEIVWMEDGLPGDDVLRARARRVAPGMSAGEVEELASAFRKWMEAPDVRRALTRGGYLATHGGQEGSGQSAGQEGPHHPGGAPLSLRVERELPFVRRVGDEIQEGIIDRVVLVERQGRVVGAEVLDFKTDGIGADDPEALAQRVEHYRPQIETYCDVIRERYGLQPADVPGMLVFLGAGVVERATSG